MIQKDPSEVKYIVKSGTFNIKDKNFEYGKERIIEFIKKIFIVFSLVVVFITVIMILIC